MVPRVAAAHVRASPRYPRVMEWQRDGYTISDDPARLDIDAIHDFLVTAYWSRGVPRDVVERSIDGSLAFGLYRLDGRQVGFARAVTDRATFCWVGDVFILPEERGRGLALWLMETIVAHPQLGRLRRWLLATRDAHALYRKVGFRELDEPGRYMVRSGSPGY
jgi:GNAT superfamily N-acetyltransferase